MRTVLNFRLGTALGVGALGLVTIAGCSDEAGGSGSGSGDGGRPLVVVTTSILGDVVRSVTDDAGVDVEVVMPLGADPHEFSPSTRQAETMSEADLLVVNGAGFEEGMEEIIERSEEAGAPLFSFADHVELLPFAEEGHAGESEEEAEAHDHDEDPHLWTDPTRIAAALPALAEALGSVEGVDAAAVEEATTAYAAELTRLDTEIEELLAPVPEERRVLVTNHEVFGYFADRYGFEVVGTVIPAGTTLAEPSSGELEDLAALIDDLGVPAVFAEATQSTRLAEALADSVGSDVEVVELFTESLGEPDSGAETYVGLMRTDAELIAGALAP
jgi:zinc/manganese transport system substrate-binding protein